MTTPATFCAIAIICWVPKTLKFLRQNRLLKAGLWWPGLAAPSIEQVREQWQADAPVVALSFYRALLQSGNTQPVEDLITALTRLDLNPLPIFISSLKDDLSQATVRVLFGKCAAGRCHQHDRVCRFLPRWHTRSNGA